MAASVPLPISLSSFPPLLSPSVLSPSVPPLLRVVTLPSAYSLRCDQRLWIPACMHFKAPDALETPAALFNPIKRASSEGDPNEQSEQAGELYTTLMVNNQNKKIQGGKNGPPA